MNIICFRTFSNNNYDTWQEPTETILVGTIDVQVPVIFDKRFSQTKNGNDLRRYWKLGSVIELSIFVGLDKFYK